MGFIRRIKKGKNTYLALVKNRREGGKVVQKVIKYIGKEIEGKACRRVNTKDVRAEATKRYADILVVHRLAKVLGLEELFGDEGRYVLAFVYSHLLERHSIKRLEEWFQGTEIPEVLQVDDISTIGLYKAVGKLSQMDFSKVEVAIFSKLRPYEKGNSSVIIDVTDTYFEGSSMDEEPRRGKDGKYRKLIQVGLGITEGHGFPIMMRTYGGNVSTFMIFKDLFTELLKRGFKAIIIDRGMGSEENIKEVLRARVKIISGLKKTRVYEERYLKKINRDEIYTEGCRVKLKNTSVYIKEFTQLGGRLIAVYNPYLEVVRRELIYEREGKDEEARYVGYSFIYHNTELSSEEVVRRYYEREIIERAFKKLKGILSLRPIRVWRREHIEGHLRVCYLSYAILTLLEYHLRKGRFDLSATQLLEKLKKGYKIYLNDAKTGFSWQTTVLLEKRLYKILDYLGCSV